MEKSYDILHPDDSYNEDITTVVFHEKVSYMYIALQ